MTDEVYAAACRDQVRPKECTHNRNCWADQGGTRFLAGRDTTKCLGCDGQIGGAGYPAHRYRYTHLDLKTWFAAARAVRGTHSADSAKPGAAAKS